MKCWCWSTSSSLGFLFIFLCLDLRGDELGQDESKDRECKASNDRPEGKKQHFGRCFEKTGDGKITCCRLRPQNSEFRSKEKMETPHVFCVDTLVKGSSRWPWRKMRFPHSSEQDGNPPPDLSASNG